MRERLLGNLEVVRVSGYGHLGEFFTFPLSSYLLMSLFNEFTFSVSGDGNIHFQVSCRQFSQDILKKIEPFVYEYTSKLRGSISAEHGIGFRKPKYIHYSKSPESVAIMKQLKDMFDPNGILNPYKVLPS